MDSDGRVHQIVASRDLYRRTAAGAIRAHGENSIDAGGTRSLHDCLKVTGELRSIQVRMRVRKQSPPPTSSRDSIRLGPMLPSRRLAIGSPASTLRLGCRARARARSGTRHCARCRVISRPPRLPPAPTLRRLAGGEALLESFRRRSRVGSPPRRSRVCTLPSPETPESAQPAQRAGRE